jgi:hypothetical protein
MMSKFDAPRFIGVITEAERFSDSIVIKEAVGARPMSGAFWPVTTVGVSNNAPVGSDAATFVRGTNRDWFCYWRHCVSLVNVAIKAKCFSGCVVYSLFR